MTEIELEALLDRAAKRGADGALRRITLGDKGATDNECQVAVCSMPGGQAQLCGSDAKHRLRRRLFRLDEIAGARGARFAAKRLLQAERRCLS